MTSCRKSTVFRTVVVQRWPPRLPGHLSGAFGPQYPHQQDRLSGGAVYHSESGSGWDLGIWVWLQTKITMENHHFLWVNPLFLWPFSMREINQGIKMWMWILYPLVNVYIANWKITIFHGKIHYEWPFSIATLNYQRVSVPGARKSIAEPFFLSEESCHLMAFPPVSDKATHIVGY